MMAGSALAFAVLLPSLLVAHNVADHWVQTSHQAGTKGQRDRAGRVACAAHVASYTAVTAAVTAGLWWLFDLPISGWGVLAGQVVSATTHYWADRRFTLAALCDRTGKGGFYRLGAPREVAAYTEPIDGTERVVELDVRGGDPPGWDNPSLGTGAYALDQSWHWAWLGVAALLTAVIP